VDVDVKNDYRVGVQSFSLSTANTIRAAGSNVLIDANYKPTASILVNQPLGVRLSAIGLDFSTASSITVRQIGSSGASPTRSVNAVTGWSCAVQTSVTDFLCTN
jgi:hypothetical protein